MCFSWAHKKTGSCKVSHLELSGIMYEDEIELNFYFATGNLLLINSFQHFKTPFNRRFRECLTLTKL
jgi:hypothetical protein